MDDNQYWDNIGWLQAVVKDQREVIDHLISDWPTVLDRKQADFAAAFIESVYFSIEDMELRKRLSDLIFALVPPAVGDIKTYLSTREPELIPPYKGGS